MGSCEDEQCGDGVEDVEDEGAVGGVAVEPVVEVARFVFLSKYIKEAREVDGRQRAAACVGRGRQFVRGAVGLLEHDRHNRLGLKGAVRKQQRALAVPHPDNRRRAPGVFECCRTDVCPDDFCGGERGAVWGRPDIFEERVCALDLNGFENRDARHDDVLAGDHNWVPERAGAHDRHVRCQFERVCWVGRAEDGVGGRRFDVVARHAQRQHCAGDAEPHKRINGLLPLHPGARNAEPGLAGDVCAAAHRL